MKKQILTGLATTAFALGAFAQGAVDINNSAYGIALSTGQTGNYFSGAYTLQVWDLNAAAVPAGINGAANSIVAYNALVGAGFNLQHTFQSTITPAMAGTVALGTLSMSDVQRAANGGNVVLGLVAFDNSYQDYAAAFAAGARIGVLAFVNPTSDYTVPPPLTPTAPDLSGWNALGTDLVMTPVPEPSTFALAGLGAAAMLIFRRRK